MRIIGLSSVLLLLFLLLPAPAAAQGYGDCYTCNFTWNLDTGEVRMWCASSRPLERGYEECDSGEVTPGWLYCQTFGDECCLDPYDI